MIFLDAYTNIGKGLYIKVANQYWCDKEMRQENYSEWSKQNLIDEVKKLKKRKKYGIVWEDKPETVATLCKENFAKLTF